MLRTGQAAGSHTAETVLLGLRDSEYETLTPDCLVVL